MADIALDLSQDKYGTPAYGDILMVNGGPVLTSDVDSRGTNVVQQRLYTRLRLLTNEWFLGLNDGVPYFPQLLTSKPAVSKFEAILQNIILDTPGVLQLVSWSAQVNRPARAFSVSFQVTSTAGDVALSIDLNQGG